MSRLARIVLGAAALAFAGCSQQAPAPPANITGSHGLAQVGDLLFVTSTERNELRVLDLSSAIVNWVRAPNPIEALSIPVLERPIGLVRDVRYSDLTLADGTVVPGGVEVGGPYVYAVSSGTAAISIVGADRTQLVELARLSAPGPVTAIAARGPGADGPSTLFYASADAVGSNLWQVSLPGPEALKAGGLAAAQGSARLLASFPAEVVTSLLVMPGAQVALATRAQPGRTGRAALLDTLTLTSRALSFPSAVRALFTHPAVPEKGLAAGARVFGFLDEEVCAAGASCSGILAVEAASGQLATDVTGHPMATLELGGGLPRGLTFAPGQSVNALGSPLPLLGIATVSNGDVYLFDAADLRHFDFDPAPASVSAPVYLGAPSAEAPAGVELPYVPGPVPGSVGVADGAARDEAISVEFQGLIPGLVGLPTQDADGLRFPADADLLARAGSGDLIEVANSAGDCGASLPVTAIDSGALAVGGPLPAACSGRTSFSVRAVGPKPYVVAGTASGYMGRTGPNEHFVFAGTYFLHPDGFNPLVPQLAFDFGPGDSAATRGNRYLLQTSSAFAPLASNNVPNNQCTATLPGSVVFADPALSAGGTRPRVFIAYPSANAVLELNPAIIVRGPTANAACYR